jgi:hypothetical protein
MTAIVRFERPAAYVLEQIGKHANEIRLAVRIKSRLLTAACENVGLSAVHAELCGGVLASVVDDLIAVGKLGRTDYERTKRKQRILATAVEPVCFALKAAIVASPVNGRAAVEHWDVICEQYEIGKFAWLLGVPTEMAWRYSRRMEKHATK